MNGRDLGILFFNPNLPDLWVHCALTQHGCFNEVKTQVDEILRQCQLAGLIVRFLATDSDPATNVMHATAFARYSHHPETERLEVIVKELLQGHHIRVWPVADPLHMTKNQRMRVVNHEVSDSADGGRVGVRCEESALFGSSPLESTSAMSDALALAMFRLSEVDRCIEADDWDAARYLLPWSLIQFVLRDPRACREARMQVVELAFVQFRTWARHAPRTGVKQGIVQRASSAAPDLPLTFMDNTHLHRACNLCIALWWSFAYIGHRVAVARIGSHPCENHSMCFAGGLLLGFLDWGRGLSAGHGSPNATVRAASAAAAEACDSWL
jgi:hypothetical protein